MAVKYNVPNPVPMPRPTQGVMNRLLAREGLLGGVAGQGDVMAYNLPPVADTPVMQEPAPQSGLLSTLAEYGSGLLSDARDVGGIVGGALADVAPQAGRNILDTIRLTEQQRMSMPSLVTAADLDKLRPISAIGIAASIPELRRQQAMEEEEMRLNRLKAQANLMRAAGGGSARYKYNQLFQSKTNPDEFVYGALDTQSGKVVDITTGTPIDTKEYTPSTGGIISKGKAGLKDLKEDYLTLTQLGAQMNKVQKFYDKLPDFEKGFAGKIADWRARAKTALGKNLTPKEIARELAKGDQQGLLGAFREQIVGGGVMTEQDAERVMAALGNSLGDWTTDPQIVAQAVQQVLSEKFADYDARIELYNAARGDSSKVPAIKVVPRPQFGAPQSWIDFVTKQKGKTVADAQSIWNSLNYNQRTDWRRDNK